MAITDLELLLADADDFVQITSAGDAIADNVYDTGPLATGNTGIDWGTSAHPLYWHILVTTALVGATSTTTFTLESDSVVALSSAAVHVTTGAIAVATLAAGFHLALPMPPDGGMVSGTLAPYERYIGVRANNAVADVTAGAVSSWISPQGDTNRLPSFASGMNFI